MKKRTKITLWSILFVIVFTVSALIRVNLLGSAPMRLMQVKWDDTVGTIYNDLNYENDYGHKYDLYVPANLDIGNAQQLILFIHGGSFNSGAKEDGEVWCKYYASKGYEAFGEKFPIQLKVDKYSMTGNLAIEMVNWKHRYPSSWAALTVDLNEVCEKDCSYVDTNHHGRKILSWIIENGLGELTGQRNRSGYCTYEKIRFYPEKLKDCDPEGYQRYKIKFEET